MEDGPSPAFGWPAHRCVSVCVCVRVYTSHGSHVSIRQYWGVVGEVIEIHRRAGTKQRKQGNVGHGGRSGNGQTVVWRHPREAGTGTQADGAEAEKRTDVEKVRDTHQGHRGYQGGREEAESRQRRV